MFFGVAAVPTLFLVFTLIFTHNEKWLTVRNKFLLGIQPIVTTILIWFDIHLVFDRIELGWADQSCQIRSEEHTSELQSLTNLVCRLLLEKKKKEHPSIVVQLM